MAIDAVTMVHCAVSSTDDIMNSATCHLVFEFILHSAERSRQSEDGGTKE
jgi:hypothetical protein